MIIYIDPSQAQNENLLLNNRIDIIRLINFLIFKIKFNVIEEQTDDNFCTLDIQIYL